VTSDEKTPETVPDTHPAGGAHTLDGPLLTAAFTMAVEVHRNQVRKGGSTPYLAHLLAVASLVWTYGGTDIEAAAAILHDSVEDGGGEALFDRIEYWCGPEVSAIVRSCSDSTMDTTGGAVKADWWTRKRAYIAHLAEPSTSDGARLVSACDKLNNLSATRADYGAVGEKLWERFNTGTSGQVWYYRELLAVYEACGDHRVRQVAREIRRELGALEEALVVSGHDVSSLPSGGAS
jgi:(p)ppGpp synthase/HD superfamily hydrolase